MHSLAEKIFTRIEKIITFNVVKDETVDMLYGISITIVMFLIILWALVTAGITPFKGSNEILIAILSLAFLIFIIAQRHDFKLNEKELNKKIYDLEKNIETSPNKSITFLQIAQSKLEKYINKNYNQVTSIFILTIVIMTIGFIILVHGIYLLETYPDKYNSSLVIIISGILIDFIGSTFLIVFRSTMKQANKYIKILERINAVSMSFQLLNIDDQDEKGRAEILSVISKLYKNNI